MSESFERLIFVFAGGNAWVFAAEIVILGYLIFAATLLRHRFDVFHPAKKTLAEARAYLAFLQRKAAARDN